MKKICCLLFFLIILFPVFSMPVDDAFLGIWEGKDRYVFINNTSDNEAAEIVICLKEYYGWYVDRTAEPEEYAKIEPRKRNSGTTRDAIQIGISEEKQLKNWENVKASEFKLTYSRFQENYIPVCVYNNQMYLNFFVQNSQDNNFYCGNSVSKGFLVSEQSVKENISGLYILDNKLYDIRYWKSDMEYSEENAAFNLDDISFYVPKHIVSGNTLYSCVSGRSKKIRNPQPGIDFNPENYNFTEDNSVLILDSEPYLIKLADKETFSELIELLNERNSKRKPDPESIFPPVDLNWYWDLIDNLEMNLEYIKIIRNKFDARTYRVQNHSK